MFNQWESDNTAVAKLCRYNADLVLVVWCETFQGCCESLASFGHFMLQKWNLSFLRRVPKYLCNTARAMWVNTKLLDFCAKMIRTKCFLSCKSTKRTCKLGIWSPGGYTAKLATFPSLPYLSEAALSVHHLHWGQWAGSLCTRWFRDLGYRWRHTAWWPCECAPPLWAAGPCQCLGSLVGAGPLWKMRAKRGCWSHLAVNAL